MKFVLGNIFAVCAFFITLPLVFAGGFFFSLIAILAIPFIVVGLLMLSGYFVISSRRQDKLAFQQSLDNCRYIFYEDVDENIIYLSDHLVIQEFDSDLAITG